MMNKDSGRDSASALTPMRILDAKLARNFTVVLILAALGIAISVTEVRQHQPLPLDCVPTLVPIVKDALVQMRLTYILVATVQIAHTILQRHGAFCAAPMNSLRKARKVTTPTL